jgi:hypothetical protein
VAITTLDAKVIVYQELLVITINMDWIPELHNNNSEELRA